MKAELGLNYKEVMSPKHTLVDKTKKTITWVPKNLKCIVFILYIETIEITKFISHLSVGSMS